MALRSLARTLAAAFVGCVLVGCGKGKPDDAASGKESATSSAPAIATTSPIEATTGAGATTSMTNANGTPAAPRPRYLRKQRPEQANASSFVEGSSAMHAFDGDRNTAWMAGGAGAGAWLEAYFFKPRTIWGLVADMGIVRTDAAGADLFAANAHARKVTLRFDSDDVSTIDVAGDRASVTWDGYERRLQHVRLVFDDVYPGAKSNDFGVTEVALLIDASKLPSVPESIVAREVEKASTRRAVAGILRRFGVNPTIDRGGEVTFDQASLVDGASRERLLGASLRSGPDGQGFRDEDTWLVFLGTNDDDGLFALGSDVVSARTHVADLETPGIAIELRALHSADVDDVVATWSTCADGGAMPCAGMRAWTMERGFPERIVDVVGNAPIEIRGGWAPYAVVDGDVALQFDARAFCYR